MIHTGMFNTLVTFYKSERVVNSIGARLPREKKEILTVYGYLSNLRGSEYWEQHHLSKKAKLRLRVRYHPLIKEFDTKTCFVTIEGIDYNILSIENVLNRNREYYMYLEGVKDEF